MSKKDSRTVVQDYVSRLGDDDLKYLSIKLSDQTGGELGTVLNRLSRNRQMDELLRSAESAYEVYDVCDILKEQISREQRRRSSRND